MTDQQQHRATIREVARWMGDAHPSWGLRAINPLVGIGAQVVARLVDTDLLSFRGSSGGILTESHRWNPHADVVELVDTLVSGSLGN
jgi:hypothetical protein